MPVKNILLKIKMFYLLPILYLLALLVSVILYYSIIAQYILSAPILLTSLFISGILPFSVKLIDRFNLLDPISVWTVIGCVIVNMLIGLLIDTVIKSKVKKVSVFLVYIFPYVISLFLYPRFVIGEELCGFLFDYSRFPGFGEWSFCGANPFRDRNVSLVHERVPLYYGGRFPALDGQYEVGDWKYCLDKHIDGDFIGVPTLAPLLYKNSLVVARPGDICSNPIGEFVYFGNNNWYAGGEEFKYVESGKPTKQFKQAIKGYFRNFFPDLNSLCSCYSSDEWLSNIKMNKDWEWNLESYWWDFWHTWIYLNKCCLRKQAVYWMNEYAKRTKSRYLKNAYVESRGDSDVLVRIPWIGFQRVDKLPGVVQLGEIPGYGQVDNIWDFIKDPSK
jgi:hypothetical protein